MKTLQQLKFNISPLTWWSKILVAVLFLVFSFPKIDATYTIGLDPSYFYALNYFFNSGIQIGREVFWSYGPLAFIEIPVQIGHNLSISILFISIISVTFTYTALTLGQVVNHKKWWLHLAIVFYACQVCFVSDMLAGITAMAILIYYESKNLRWLALVIIVSILALCIRSSTGITCLLLLGTYSAIEWFSTHYFKKVMKIAISLIVVYLAFWFCIYRNFEGSWGYLWASFQLTKGYSSALSTYAENNWWLIGGSLVSFFLVPFLYKNKRVSLLYRLFFLSIFTAWKHSYSREEEVHLTIFYGYLVLFLLVFLIYINKLKIVQLALIILALMGIHKNMVMTGLYHVDERVFFNKSRNFYDVFFDRKKLIENAISESENNVRSKKLPAEVLKMIGNKTIDFYPSEVSYVAANKLNWKPRPIIQAYNTYTEWLDKQDARYYRSDSGAEFILWEYTSDRWGRNNFGELDNRYVLNDEPNAIYELLNHYNAVYKDSTFILFRRNTVNNLSVPKTIKSEETTWNQWIKVPQVDDGIVRAKMMCGGNLLRSIKTVLFKDEVFYMDCKLTNGNVIQYRIIPENAQRGLWINPLFGNNMDKPNVSGAIVDEIRFTCSNTKLMQNEIKVDWDLIDVKKHDTVGLTMNPKEYSGKFKNAYSLFMQNQQPAEKIIFNSLNDFENQYNNWSYNLSSITAETKFNGKKSELMNEEDNYSSVFSDTIDAYLSDSTNLVVDASAWVKVSDKAKGVLVVQLSDDNGTFFWKGRLLSDHINDRSEWEQIFAEEQIVTKKRKNVRLGIYLTKAKGERIWISDFDVKLYSQPQSH